MFNRQLLSFDHRFRPSNFNFQLCNCIFSGANGYEGKEIRKNTMTTLRSQINTNGSMTVRSKYHVTQEQMLDEQEVVEAAKKDSSKFEPLYKKYYEQIFRYIYQRMDDPEQAHDVTSQVFMKALMNLYRYEFRGVPFSSWLYRIALSETNNYFKKKKAQRAVNVDSVQIFDMIEEYEDEDRQVLHDKMIQAINGLNDDDLLLIEMRYFEKRPFKEIAEILGITENNAKVKTYRILERLKKNIIKNL